MAAVLVTYDLPMADQLEAYGKWALDTVQNIALKQPGIVEVRSYRDLLRNTPQVMVFYEFDSMDHAAQYARSDAFTKAFTEATSHGCRNLVTRLLDTSPVLREPARPTN